MGTIVITTFERDERTGRMTPVASHGVDARTGQPVTLPCLHPSALGAEFDPDLGEYIIAAGEASTTHERMR